MTVTCPYCKRKFHKGKTNEFSRMTKHIWKEHADVHRKRIKKGKKKPKEILEEELQFTDDLYLAVLLEMNERLERLEGTPTIHKDAIGMVISELKEIKKHAGQRAERPLVRGLLGATGYRAVGGKYKERKKKK